MTYIILYCIVWVKHSYKLSSHYNCYLNVRLAMSAIGLRYSCKLSWVKRWDSHLPGYQSIIGSVVHINYNKRKINISNFFNFIFWCTRKFLRIVKKVCMYAFNVFNFFRDAILISYTAGFHEGRLFSYLQVYKNEEKTN